MDRRPRSGYARLLRIVPPLFAAGALAAFAAAVVVGTLHPRDDAPAAPHAGHAAHAAPVVPDRPSASGDRTVADLTGPRDGAPDVRFELTARHATITLGSGATADALTFDGTAPGPELRVREGQLVEVVLRNADVAEGVTLHWHGVDVPNAEDGVAGVTQDAVLPGGAHAYRFRPHQVGTFWYHSHQDPAVTVPRGLYGALVVEPATTDHAATGLDTVLLGHTWAAAQPRVAIGTADGPSRRDVTAGARVRARLVNTDSVTRTWTVAGAAFTVTGIDGTEVHGPTALDGARMRIPAGGRLDVEFTAPATVALLDGTAPAVGFGTDPAVPAADGPLFDPLAYGTPAPTPFPAAGPFDRDLTQVLDTVRTVHHGIPSVTWTINGQQQPPAETVAEGELVRITLRNDGTDPHPMHLHGHHVLVLTRDGVPASGSPWWADTVDVLPGETWVVAFRADNPGIWMDHCHNLTHAAAGMVLHLEYRGVSTTFHHGDGTENTPE